MKYVDLKSKPWEGYELLDSGENMKLERFGEVVVARPETQALWKKAKPHTVWQSAQAVFAFRDKKGSWDIRTPMPKPWSIRWNNITLSARLTGFKHTGIFPEQEPNWVWLDEQVRKMEKPNVLNLFGYTGAATLVAAHAGAVVTHVDASKQSLAWARENAERSTIEEECVRWILEDTLAFVKREVRRGQTYQGIILDPPAFGRGAKGEVWHIEQDLPALLELVKELLANVPGSFFLLNGYAAGYAPTSFAQAIESTFENVRGEYGELRISESDSDRVIPSGIYVRFVRE